MSMVWSKPESGRHFHLVRKAAGWVVINDREIVVSGPHQMRSVAEQSRRALQAAHNAKAKVGPRPCITCSATFDSEGVHHRMCLNCRRNSEAFPGIASVSQRGARRVAKS